MSKPRFSRRTRNILGIVVLVLAAIVVALVVRNELQSAALARQETAAAELALRVAQADATDVMLYRHPEQYADVLTPELLTILQRGQERYQQLYDQGKIGVSVVEAKPPVRQDVDLGEDKVLYVVEMAVDVRAHPTLSPGKYPTRTTILLHREGDAWKVSKIGTVIR